MTTTNKWHFVQHDSPYYDYDKELYSLPDKGNTSVDMRLTFDADYKTCYYTISLHNDDGNTRDWEKDHQIPWAVGVAMLAADGVTFFKEPPTVTSLPYQQSLSDLQAKLDAAIKECERCARPAHMVRNCPSASENETQAWRHRQSIEFQIRELTKGE